MDNSDTKRSSIFTKRVSFGAIALILAGLTLIPQRWHPLIFGCKGVSNRCPNCGRLGTDRSWDFSVAQWSHFPLRMIANNNDLFVPMIGLI